MRVEQPIKVELPTKKELGEIEKNDFLESINGFVNEKLRELEEGENSVIISIEELRNAAAIDEFGDNEIKFVIDYFNNKESGITVSEYIVDGKTEKKLQFIRKELF